jgi:hypothetical protein
VETLETLETLEEVDELIDVLVAEEELEVAAALNAVTALFDGASSMTIHAVTTWILRLWIQYLPATLHVFPMMDGLK